MGDEQILKDGCVRARVKNSTKEGKIGMIRRVQATLAKMVVCGDSPISHKLRMGGTRDRRQSQMAKGTVRTAIMERSDNSENDSDDNREH